MTNSYAPSNKILLVSHSDSSEKQKLQPAKDNIMSDSRNAFSHLFICYLISCIDFSKDPFEPSSSRGIP